VPFELDDRRRLTFFLVMPPDPTSLDEALSVIAELRKELAQQRAFFEAQIAELRAQLEQALQKAKQNSSNSNKPPSSDGPSKPPTTRSPSGRSRGGQKGHKGSSRRLIENPDETIPCKPGFCGCCGLPLLGDDPTPERHQVTELPAVKAEVIEYQRHTLRCSCGATTKGEFPLGISYRTFGPRLTAMVGWLAGKFHLSHRDLVEILCEGFGVEMSLGSVSLCQRQVAMALGASHEEARQAVEQSACAHADETSFGLAGKRGWLWVAVTEEATLFLLRERRDRVSAKALLGEFDGYLVTDRWAAYDDHPLAKRQVCWAHLLRHFVQMSEYRGEMGGIGSLLVAQTKRLFRLWWRVREETLSRADFAIQTARLRSRVEQLLVRGAHLGHALSGRCREIWSVAAALWTFVRVEGVEPTNNTAERAVRQGVLWRKSSHGVQSSTGQAFAERMLTVVATLKQQKRNAKTFLEKAVQALAEQVAGPRLLASAQPP
jgi:transposase